MGGGEEQRVLRSEKGYAVMKNGIYFGKPNDDGTTSIRLLNLATGEEKELATIRKPVGFIIWPSLSVSPDETFLLYVQVDHSVQDLWLVENLR